MIKNLILVIKIIMRIENECRVQYNECTNRRNKMSQHEYILAALIANIKHNMMNSNDAHLTQTTVSPFIVIFCHPLWMSFGFALLYFLRICPLFHVHCSLRETQDNNIQNFDILILKSLVTIFKKVY